MPLPNDEVTPPVTKIYLVGMGTYFLRDIKVQTLSRGIGSILLSFELLNTKVAYETTKLYSKCTGRTYGRPSWHAWA